VRETPYPLADRNDLPVTFLSEPEEYEGRELVVGDLYISREIQPRPGTRT
jgi:predicted 2-oxoglutarate/Fe(II)-dependent dioxygenase YbiX